jgi:hypothetical protein
MCSLFNIYLFIKYLMDWFLSNEIECYLSIIELPVATHGHDPSRFIDIEYILYINT